MTTTERRLRVVVVGAGVAGLTTALWLSRAGHDVTIVERDDTPLPADPTDAFAWDRRGAPQVRHSHAFLARLRNLLAERHPDVLAALLRAGATEMDFIDMLPEGMDRTRRPGDEELVALACRRTTFEWVLRRIVIEEHAVGFLHGVALRTLLADAPPGDHEVPLVRGVELTDATTLGAEVVLLAGGRRMDVPSLLAPFGVSIPERTEDTGIVYMSRFFRLHDDAEYPPQLGPVGGDLGYVKFGVFPGDDRTFSITLAVASTDAELRRRLVDPDTFLAVAARLPATAAHVDGRAEPITGVEAMGGLINRRRDFLDADGEPLVLGVHAVGDAHTATNPLYGRGCSLAAVQADALADALEVHGADHRARALAYEATCEAEVRPWYRAAVAQDRMSRDAAAAAAVSPEGSAGDGSAAQGSAGGDATTFLREGLFPAVREDPVVLRAFLRMLNLLDPPDSITTNTEVIGRVMQVYQRRDERPPEAPLGPDRDELLAAIS